MKKIGDFLFVEQSFADIEETKQAVVNINYIDNIVCNNHDKLGEVVVIETDNTRIICKNPEQFFEEFSTLMQESEEWQSIK